MRTSFVSLLGSAVAAFLLACGSNSVATRMGDDNASAQAGGSNDTTGGGGVGNGGASGTGGTSHTAGGSVGVGGAAGASGAGGSSVATVSCADLPLCDDFESDAADGPPSAAKWKVGGPNGIGTGTLAVDGTQAHSGTKSVRVTGKDNYNNHIFFYNETAVAGIGKLVFGRMFVRFGRALADGHVTFMTMKDSVDMKDLRMGGQMKILMYNRELNDATLPEMSPMGIAKSLSPTPNTWICLEFKIDSSTGEIQTWADGNEILGLHADGTPTPDIDGQWVSGMYKPSLSDIKFGWESYGNGGDMTLWFDDVALAVQRIGCK